MTVIMARGIPVPISRPSAMGHTSPEGVLRWEGDWFSLPEREPPHGGGETEAGPGTRHTSEAGALCSPSGAA